MDQIFCTNCGKQLTSTAGFCPFCGTQKYDESDSALIDRGYEENIIIRQKIPGRSFGISGFVLSLFSGLFSFISLEQILSLIKRKRTIENEVDLIINEGFLRDSISHFYQQIILSAIILSLSFVFLLLAKKKGYMTKKSWASIIILIFSVFFLLIALMLKILVYNSIKFNF